MIEDLTRISFLDAGRFILDPEPVDVVTLIEDAITSASNQLQACAQFLKMVMAQIGQAAEEVQLADASWVSFRLTELLPFSSTIKQKMLELTDANTRLEVLYRFLRDQQLIQV